MNFQQAGGRILIIGSGSMACLFAYKMAMAGSNVSMYGRWREGIGALQRKGVTLVEESGALNTVPLVIATSDPDELGDYDLILFFNKTYQLESTLDSLARWWKQHQSMGMMFITMQNGLGNVEKISERFFSSRCFAGTTTYAASLLKPGMVKQTGVGQIDLPQALMNEPINQWLKDAGFHAMGHKDITQNLWRKLVINCAINPLTAIFGIENGELLKRQAIRKQMESVINEVVDVAVAQGIVLGRDEMTKTVENVCIQTSNNISSMRKDVERGAGTEIDAINGAVVEIGLRAGIPVPVNQGLVQQIKEKAG